MPEVAGVGARGGSQRHHDTHSIGCSGHSLTVFKKNPLYFVTGRKAWKALGVTTCTGVTVTAISCTLSLEGKRLVTTCTGVAVPAGTGHECGNDVLLLPCPGGTGGRAWCLNIEKSKIFTVFLDSNSVIVIITYDYLCQSSLASFPLPINFKSFKNLFKVRTYWLEIPEGQLWLL